MNNSQWLQWAQQLQAIAQIGTTYGRDEFDLERYKAIGDIAAEIMAKGAGLTDSAPIRLELRLTSEYEDSQKLRTSPFRHRSIPSLSPEHSAPQLASRTRREIRMCS